MRGFGGDALERFKRLQRLIADKERGSALTPATSAPALGLAPSMLASALGLTVPHLHRDLSLACYYAGPSELQPLSVG